MSPRTPVFPLVLALVLWAAGLAASSRGLEACAAASSVPAGATIGQVPQGDERRAPPALAPDALLGTTTVATADGRRGAEESVVGPFSSALPRHLEPASTAARTPRPRPASSSEPLYLHQRSLRC